MPQSCDATPAIEESSSHEAANSPLFVDLDGTLIRTDLLQEAVLCLAKKSFSRALRIPLWLLKGRAYMKRRLANEACPNIGLVPANTEFVNFLVDEKRRGRQIFLATASDEIFANKIADRFGLFEGVIASDGTTNMKGAEKARRCQELSATFSYAGNDRADFEIFAHAQQRFLVSPTRTALSMSKKVPVTRVWTQKQDRLRLWARALRVHQWAKNLLLFVPLLAAHLYGDPRHVIAVAVGFVAFGLLASATYIVNDLFDLESDRRHPTKKARPFAAGDLPIAQGIFAAAVLGALSVTISLLLPFGFAMILLAYLVSTLLYSIILKQYVVIDVIALAGLYTLRIVAGTMLLGVELSFWLLAFSMFTFFGLALVKRCAELRMLTKSEEHYAQGREYTVDDYQLMQTFGVSAAFLSVLVMAFFIEDSLTSNVYARPVLLWFVLPAYGYWFCRMWLKTSRMEMHDDPIVFSVSDRGSLITIGFICLVVLAARFL